jgi:outer membrane protein OmpA-like peptidoglycan-associated protein
MLISGLLVLWSCLALAGDLSFPITEKEIVNSLRLKDGKMIYEGAEYIAEKGKVYKIIDGKRYRLRGVQVMAASDILPKVGALVNFDFDSADIRSGSYPLLDEFGKAFKKGLSKAVVVIAGHTDSKGSMEYNQELSENRANSVANYLQSHHGISTKRIIIKGFGETKPIAANDTDDGRFNNRRVEFIRVE